MPAGLRYWVSYPPDPPDSLCLLLMKETARRKKPVDLSPLLLNVTDVLTSRGFEKSYEYDPVVKKAYPLLHRNTKRLSASSRGPRKRTKNFHVVRFRFWMPQDRHAGKAVKR